MTTYLNYLGQPMPQSADPGNSAVVGNDPNGGDTWTAPAGNSSVQGGGGGDTLVGNTGDTTFIVTNPNDVVVDQANSGIDSVVAYVPFALPDNVTNLTVSNDFNYAVGNDLDNLIIVSGAQWVDGGAGNDVLVGGSGAAVFEEQAGQGNDVIYGWHAGDTIQLIDPALTNFSQVQAAMTQQGSDVVIQMASDETLTIRDVTTSQLNASSFFLPLDTSQLGAMTFDDEFNTLDTYNASTNTGQWETNFGGNLKDAWAYTLVANGEQEEYITPGFRGQGEVPTSYNPFSIHNGVLTITASQMTASEQSAAYVGTYYSGMLNTLDTFQQQYGYFEIRAALPDATGSWPAFWLEPAPFIPNAEADVTEHLGRTPDIDYVRAFGGDGSTQTLYNNVYMDDPTGFHTYGLLWTPTTVTFYLDGNEIMTGPTPNTWTQPMGMILNLAMGGPWAGTPDGSPVSMDIDYVRAYSLADGSTIVENPTPAVPAATIRADGSEIAASAADAHLVTPVFDNGGAPITSNAIEFSTTAPNGNNLPAGDTFYVYNASGAVDVVNAANGQLGTATTIIAGDVSQFNGGTWLTDGSVALTYYQVDNGVKDLWVAVLNQATGELYKQELGSADANGDVHIVALANDGFAVSWSSGGTITGIAYDAHAYDGKGWLGQTITLPGDLQGINSDGDLVAAVNGSSSVQLYQVLTPSNVVPASLSLSPPNIVEADPASGTTTYTYTVTRSYDFSGTSTVDWTVIGNAGSPAPASDFEGGVYPTGHLTFNPGDTTATITITVLGGLNLTQDQTFAVTLKNVSGAVLAAATASGDIAPTGTDVGGGGDTGGGTGGTTTSGDGSTVDTAATNYTVPDGVTTVVLTGSTAQNVTANNLGDTITSNDHGSTIVGGSGNDTIIAGHANDTLIGGGGADTFIFNGVPWSAGQITDFTPGTDKIDLTGLLNANGYTGTDPVADGWVVFGSDGHGNTLIEVNTHDASNPWPLTVVTLDGVASSAMSGADIVYEGSTGSGGTGGGTTGGGGTGGGSTGGGSSVETAATPYTVPDGVTNVVLTGATAQTVTANNLGDTITSNDHGSTIIGGTGTDVLIAGHGADTLTGGGGDDFFVFSASPWSAGQITDFALGSDKLDLSAMLSAAGYTGTDPVADGWVTFSGDGQGDTQVMFNAHDPSNPWPSLITTLDHISPTGLTSAEVLGTAPAADAGSGGTTTDGGGSTTTNGSSVSTSAATYTAPDGVTNITLTGSSAQTVTGNNAGDTITSNDSGSTIIGGSGADTIIAGHSADTLTGNGGADSFVFNYLPWNAGHITDFNTAMDVLDLKGIFAAIGYTGSNPIADGYLNFASDGSGNTKVIVDPQGHGTTTPITVTTLDHVSASAIHSGDYLFA